MSTWLWASPAASTPDCRQRVDEMMRRWTNRPQDAYSSPVSTMAHSAATLLPITTARLMYHIRIASISLYGVLNTRIHTYLTAIIRHNITLYLTLYLTLDLTPIVRQAKTKRINRRCVQVVDQLILVSH